MAGQIAESFVLRISTEGDGDIVDLTDDLERLARESGVRTGQLTAMVRHSTAALSTLEYEPGLVNHDIAAAMEGIAPEDAVYRHEETWNDDNGHSHVRATLIGPSLAVPVVDGTLPFGTWQQPVLLDFDTRPREREVSVTVMGAGS